jgi:uncharacterized membrane protein
MKCKTVVTTAIASAFTLAAANTAFAADKPEAEKCYGVVKAGKNDCQTATSACAGQSTADGQSDAWVYLPKGSCDKIVGGSTKPKA